ncbi:Otu2 protein [Starmerella bacillaris]|uniref:Otu2 protein n=1 Tax=Starmerella bacillaris TaxID=1247836 RepID=A0AAV5RM26_STABA|nr:Otu2 protein [Starmerella bacillaris]
MAKHNRKKNRLKTEQRGQNEPEYLDSNDNTKNNDADGAITEQDESEQLAEQLLKSMSINDDVESTKHNETHHLQEKSSEITENDGRKRSRNRRREKIKQREENYKKLLETTEEPTEFIQKQHHEDEILMEHMKTQGLTEYQIRADGHCLFNAIGDQLDQIYGLHVSASKLRSQAAEFIANNPETFAPYLIPDLEEKNINSKQYLEKLRSGELWGGQPEIVALSNIYEVPIMVYTGSEKTLSVNVESEKQPLQISYYLYKYGLGAHYNSLRCAIPNTPPNLEASV